MKSYKTTIVLSSSGRTLMTRPLVSLNHCVLVGPGRQSNAVTKCFFISSRPHLTSSAGSCSQAVQSIVAYLHIPQKVIDFFSGVTFVGGVGYWRRCFGLFSFIRKLPELSSTESCFLVYRIITLLFGVSCHKNTHIACGQQLVQMDVVVIGGQIKC